MTISRLLLAILLSLFIGFGLGFRAHRVLAPVGRFVATDTQGSTALDSKTGQFCLTMSDAETGNKDKDLPTCLDLYRKY